METLTLFVAHVVRNKWSSALKGILPRTARIPYPHLRCKRVSHPPNFLKEPERLFSCSFSGFVFYKKQLIFALKGTVLNFFHAPKVSPNELRSVGSIPSPAGVKARTKIRKMDEFCNGLQVGYG